MEIAQELANIESLDIFLADLCTDPATRSRDAHWLQRTRDLLGRYRALLASLESEVKSGA